MGQRLNLSINKNGKVLANCYYHWSGYTNSAMQKAQQALAFLDDQEGEIGVKEAVLALKETGATIDAENAKDYVEPDEEIHRDDGIIATTEDDIKVTEMWSECEIIIDVGTRKVNLIDAISEYDEEDIKEYFDIDITTLNRLEVEDLEQVDIDNFWYPQDFFEENSLFKYKDGFYGIIE